MIENAPELQKRTKYIFKRRDIDYVKIHIRKTD